jgi:hypothetical protein
MKFKKGKYADIDCCFVNSGYLKSLMSQDWFITDWENKELISDIQCQLDDRKLNDNNLLYDIVDVEKNKIWRMNNVQPLR